MDNIPPEELMSRKTLKSYWREAGHLTELGALTRRLDIKPLTAVTRASTASAFSHTRRPGSD